MAEYVLGPDEDQETVAKRLLAAAKDPASVHWSPRPNSHPHGGVYVLPDDDADAIIAAVAKQRAEQTAAIEQAQKLAEERDAKASETGLTPEQLGFPAATGADVGAVDTDGDDDAGDEADEDPEDEADEAVVDDPSTAVDEHTEAQDRVAKRRAARKAAATPAANEQKSE